MSDFPEIQRSVERAIAMPATFHDRPIASAGAAHGE
jgi:hypothetical protein